VLTHYLPFAIDEWAFGIELDRVRRVLPMVAITPLPGAPDIILGAVNVEGVVVPVANLRCRLNLGERGARLSDRLIHVHGGCGELLLPADSVGVARDCDPARILPVTELPTPVPHLRGVLRLDDGLLLIQDVDAFLSLSEQEALAHALRDDAVC